MKPAAPQIDAAQDNQACAGSPNGHILRKENGFDRALNVSVVPLVDVGPLVTPGDEQHVGPFDDADHFRIVGTAVLLDHDGLDRIDTLHCEKGVVAAIFPRSTNDDHIDLVIAVTPGLANHVEKGLIDVKPATHQHRHLTVGHAGF